MGDTDKVKRTFLEYAIDPRVPLNLRVQLEMNCFPPFCSYFFPRNANVLHRYIFSLPLSPLMHC